MSEERLDSEEAIVSAFQQMLEERDRLGQAVIDRRHEAEEFALVIKTLEPLDGDRKCSQLVGDVLVDRTVAEVLPGLRKTRDNLTAMVENIGKQLEAKQKQVLEFGEKHKIRVRGEPGGGGGGGGGAARGGGAAPGGSGGVLVGGGD